MGNFNTNVTILFIDDEQVILDVGTLMLEKLGYKVLQAASGMKASQVFRDNTDEIGLVILDMKLPDELGTETCKRLRGIKSDVMVLHTSGLGITESGDILECGCDGFLPKPFKIDELSNKLIDLLENTNRKC